MANKQPAEHQEPFNIGDIYFVLFKHKWIILTFFALGVVAAGGLLVVKPPQYESDAKLYVQYVMDVKTPATATGEDPAIKQTSSSGADIVLTELEFLTSLDLAQQVAERVGPEKILAKYGGGSDTNAAAGVILKNLVAEPALKTPSIILLSFSHPDAEVARAVLSEIIDAYIAKSREQHLTIGASDDFLDQETARLREQLEATEKELSAAKSDAGIISTLEETKEGWNKEYVSINEDLLEDGLKLAPSMHDGGAQSSSVVTNATNQLAVTNTLAGIPASARDDYRGVCWGLNQARAAYNADIVKYPEGSLLLKDSKNLVDSLEARKGKLEEQYPDITRLEPLVTSDASPQGTQAANGVDSGSQVEQLTAQTNYLAGKLAELRRDQTNLEAREPHILELQHRKDMEETALTRFMASLEQNRMGGDQSSSAGIKIAESPTPAGKKWSKTVKKLVGIALAGGVFGGIGLAFFLEMVLDRTVKRPGEVEKKLHLPLFISIPDVNQNGNRRVHALAAKNRLLLKNANGADPVEAPNGSGPVPATGAIAPWDHRHPLHRFYAGLRDRLVVNFEIRNLNHNPKLVGVTSCGKGAGVSSVAAGLAASLSSSGDGNVLLVDMRAEQGASVHFHKGKPTYGQAGALEAGIKNNTSAADPNPDSAEGDSADGMPSGLSKRFATLMPKLKASDYDYIIFDMPPVSQTSMTPRLAGLMDMVLLVIESEKTHRDSVQRATALLQESRAQVSTVLNKVKSYVPAKLHQEYLDDEV